MKSSQKKLKKVNYILENFKSKLPKDTYKKLTLLKHSLQEATLGVVSTSDPIDAEKLVKRGVNVRLTKKGTDVVSTSTNKLMEAGITFTSEEVKKIAIQVGKSLIKALREEGEEVSSMTAKKITENSFILNTNFKSGTNKEYSFYLDGDKLHLQDNSFDKELIEVGIQPSGEALVNKDVLKNELLKHFQTLNEITSLPRKKLKELIFEAYYEYLKEAEEDPLAGLENPSTPEEKTPEVEPLKDATDSIIEKFPSLKHILEKLMTKDYKEFVEEIDWISPRPTAFRINLKNGQDFNIKWTGKGFEAQIKGKKYFLNKVDEYQQALDKLAILYKEGPMGTEEEESMGASFGEKPEKSSTGGGGGGGTFPGSEPAGGETEGEPAPEFGGEGEAGGEPPAETPPADLGGEEINFEEPEEEPKA